MAVVLFATVVICAALTAGRGSVPGQASAARCLPWTPCQN